jgi:hypothetical protein
MRLHVRPRYARAGMNVELVGIHVEPFDLWLRGGFEVTARRPYPNKEYLVACRKKGKLAVDGILIETRRSVSEFTCSTFWRLGEGVIARHHVLYRLLDHDFKAASDCMMLWRATTADLGGWSNRMPSGSKRAAIYSEPVMEDRSHPDRSHTEDIIHKKSGLVLIRRQVFEMPTIEPKRLQASGVCDRLPALDSAFKESEVHGSVPERIEIGTCMLCGKTAAGWCGCSNEPSL